MPSPTRRETLTLVGASCIGLAGCVSLGSPTGNLDEVTGEWPVGGRTPGRTRRVSSGPTDPETVWTTDVGDAGVVGTPSIADGQVYVLSDARTDLARHRFRLHAVQARNGDERWRVPLRSDPIGPPAIGSERIVVSAQRGLEQGRIVAFGDRYGDEEWLYDVDARVTAPPMIEGSAVYLADWGGTVHALSITDGSTRWSRTLGRDDTRRAVSRPIAVHDGTLYAASHSGETGVTALDAATGEEQWFRSTDRVTKGPVVDDDLLVIRSGSLITAFDTVGTKRWVFNPAGDHRLSPLALDDEHVYVSTGSTLYAIDRDGEPRWEYGPFEELGPATIAGDDVLVASEGRLVALARTDGTRQWSVDIDGNGDVVSTPEAIFTSGPGGKVTALGAE